MAITPTPAALACRVMAIGSLGRGDAQVTGGHAMAFTPCAFHGGKYAGGANTFFLRLVRGGEQRGGKIQCCANCATLALDWLHGHAVKVSEGDRFLEYTDPLACGNCGGDLGEDSTTLYGNAYPRGHAESQWYARICGACQDAVAADLRLDSAARRW